MAQRIVYRLEDQDGCGPYAYGGLAFPMEFPGGIGPDSPHPEPTDDGICEADFTTRHHCGFASLDQAARWFGYCARNFTAEDPTGELDATGQRFTLAVYSVPEEYVADGHRQIVFERQLARKVGELEPEVLVELGEDEL